MVPNRDYYADKHGRLTTDASQSAFQIAIKGCFLDERIAQRYGISNDLVSVDEPSAPRRVERMEIEIPEEPQEPVVEAEPEAEEAKVKPATKKGDKKK